MPHSDVSGVRIHYEVRGDGPPMVLLHANPFDHRMWMFQVAHFSRWFTVIAIDLRGYGGSERGPTDFDLADLVGDVVGVCRREGVTRTVVAGVSVGSGIGLLMALEHPELVSALVLVGGSSRGPAKSDLIVSGLLEAADAGTLETFLWSRLQRYVAPGFAETRLGHWLLRMFVEEGEGLSAETIAQFYRARRESDLTCRLRELRLPVLVLNGEHDVSLEDGRRTAARIPQASHVVIAGTGHAACLEDPGAFNSLLTSFLRTHDLMPEDHSVHDDVRGPS